MCNDAERRFINYCYSIHFVEVVVIFEGTCVFANTKDAVVL
jgi:hypothetical protein